MWWKGQEPQPHLHITVRGGCVGSEIQLEKQAEAWRGISLGLAPTPQR